MELWKVLCDKLPWELSSKIEVDVLKQMCQCSSKNLYKYSHLEGWSWTRSFIPCVSENSKKGRIVMLGRQRYTCSPPRVGKDCWAMPLHLLHTQARDYRVDGFLDIPSQQQTSWQAPESKGGLGVVSGGPGELSTGRRNARVEHDRAGGQRSAQWQHVSLTYIRCTCLISVVVIVSVISSRVAVITTLASGRKHTWQLARTYPRNPGIKNHTYLHNLSRSVIITL